MIPKRVLDRDGRVIVREFETRRTPLGPREFEVRREAAPTPLPPVFTLLSCIFLHGGWMHFLGNMWFLWIFGDNVEDRFGHLGYLIFYLLAGVGASASHLAFNGSSTMPTIGASGAIAGVMGAYYVLYPHARVLTLIPFFYFFHTVMLPASLYLGLWFLLQLYQGAASVTRAVSGGVAWWAHIGGFVLGAGAVFALRKSGLLRDAPRRMRSRMRY
jgi:hypothetical protein